MRGRAVDCIVVSMMIPDSSQLGNRVSVEPFPNKIRAKQLTTDIQIQSKVSINYNGKLKLFNS